MSINFNTLLFFKKNIKKIRNKDVLILGAQNLNEQNFSSNQCRKLGIDYQKIKKLFKKKKNSDNLKNKYFHNKELLKYIFKSIGYNSLRDLDFNGLADYKIDMSKDVKINKKFGLIWDGISEYAFDFTTSRSNTIKLLANGGSVFFYFDHTSFNRYPVNLSPEYLVDFYCENGMSCKSIDIVNYQNKFVSEYKLNFIDKGTTFFQNLSFLNFLKFLISLISSKIFLPNAKYKIDPLKYKKLKKGKFKNLKNYKNKHNLISRVIIKLIFILRLNYIGRYNFRYVFVKKNNIKNKNYISSTLHYSIFNQET